MKHLSLCLAAFMALLSTAATAQSYKLNEGFEGSTFPPAGWTVVDNDGDGHCWQQGGAQLTVHGGSKVALAYSSDPASYPVVDYERRDNWLITPQVEIDNDAFALTAYYTEEDISSSDSLLVMVSTTGNRVADFTDNIAKFSVSGDGESVMFEKLTRSLAKYVGQKIYIAFVHQGTGGYAIALDDVSVTNEKGPRRVSRLTAKPATDGSNNVTLSWTNPTTNAQSAALGSYQVKVYRDNVLIATLPQKTTAYTDTGASAGDHVYGVSISTSEGESLQRTVKAHAGEDVPASATNVKAEVANGNVVLSWTAPAEGANEGYVDVKNLKYNIWKSVDGGASKVVATGYTSTTLTEPIADGQLTYYEVAAVNAAGEGEKATSNRVVTFSGSNDEITVGENATSDARNKQIPIDAYSRSTVSETIYYPEDLHFAKGKISHIIYRNSFGPNTNLTRPLQIYVGETTEESLSGGWILPSSLTKVFDGNITMNTNENDIPLTLNTPYNYKGGNLVVLVYGAQTKYIGTYADHFMVEKTPAHANRSRFYSGYSDIDITGLVGSNGDVIAEVPYTRFVMKATGVGKLSGAVTSTTNEKISGAQVSLPAYNLTTTTDAAGHYQFSYVPVGEQKIGVTATGFADYASTVTIAEGGTVSNIQLEALARVSYSGRVVADDTNKALAGAKVIAKGYDETTTTTDASGNFTLTGIYAGKDYTISIEKSNYDIFAESINTVSNIARGTVTLHRSLVAPFAVNAVAAADGSKSTITWKKPTERTGRMQWTVIGNSAIHSDVSGDSFYSPDDYSVAHYWTAEDTQDSAMVGQSFTGMRIWLKATQGTFTAHVWRGGRLQHESLAEADIPLKSIPADGGWVDVTFDEPVEIRKGESYMVGVNIKNGSDDPIGVYGEFDKAIDGKNNVKFTDKKGRYTYNGYYAWNISAHVGIPGTQLPVDAATAQPEPTYTVFRSNADSTWTKLASDIATANYTDASWQQLSPGKYIYKVTADYKRGSSLAAYSDTIVRAINTDAGVAAIVSPQKSTDKQTSVDVSFYMKNYGEKPLTSVPVSLIVNGTETGSTTWTGSLAKGDSTLVSFSGVALEDNKLNTIEVVTAAEDDKTSQNNSASITISNLPNITMMGFRWDIYEANCGPVVINTNNPEASTLVRSVLPDGSIMAAGAIGGDGNVYGYTSSWQSVPQKFVGLDPSSWIPTASNSTDDFVLDLSYNPTDKKMYALAAKLENGKTLLTTVDLENGSLTIADTLQNAYHAFAIDKSGQMFGIDATGTLYRFHHMGNVTAEIPVGATGVTGVKYFQSMTFDEASGRLFWVYSGENSHGQLYEVSTTDGKATLLGTVMTGGEPSEIVSLYSNAKTNGISHVTTTREASIDDAPRYNLAGQRVGKSYRGVVIVNGKKIITH